MTILRGILELPAEMGGLQKNLLCLRLSAMFNWNRTCPWKEIHCFGEMKCSVWTNGEMTSPRIVKVQTLELISCASVSFLHWCVSSAPLHHAIAPSLQPLLLSCSLWKVPIPGYHWVSGLRGTLATSSCRHTCPPSWSPSSPGSPSGSITMPLQLGWPLVRLRFHCSVTTQSIPSEQSG